MVSWFHCFRSVTMQKSMVEEKCSPHSSQEAEGAGKHQRGMGQGPDIPLGGTAPVTYFIQLSHTSQEPASYEFNTVMLQSLL